jgi:7-cyano-7-deazaguanine synthase
MRIVAVVSGGLDSSVMAHVLHDEGHDLHTISFDYGQRHRRELDCARALAGDLGVPWELVDLHAAGVTRLLGGSALTDDAVAVPEGHYADESMRATVVPNRNAMMLTVACALAGGMNAGAVAFAVHGGDHPIYPDCRPEFVRAFEEMERLAMDAPGFRVLAPFVAMTKADIVRLGAAHGVDFARTWSCYNGRAVHCGRCGTCCERREAFDIAGVPDPTEYE